MDLTAGVGLHRRREQNERGYFKGAAWFRSRRSLADARSVRFTLPLSLTIEICASLRIRQGPRLDQQTLSLVAAAGPAEVDHDRIPGALGLRAPREQRVARRQILEIIEADAAQARRTGILHHQEIAAAAAPMALPLPVQGLDNHEFRRSACLLRKALALFLGKLRRHPLRAIRRLDCGVSASAEAQRLAARRPRDIVRRACEQPFRGRPGPE